MWHSIKPYSAEANYYVRCLLGHSVCCNVHGFEPYFYINCPPGMGPDDISRFHQILEVLVLEFEPKDHFLFIKCLQFTYMAVWGASGEDERVQ